MITINGVCTYFMYIFYGNGVRTYFMVCMYIFYGMYIIYGNKLFITIIKVEIYDILSLGKVWCHTFSV